jgi:NADPH-dependent curcumin reductase CurA
MGSSVHSSGMRKDVKVLDNKAISPYLLVSKLTSGNVILVSASSGAVTVEGG